MPCMQPIILNFFSRQALCTNIIVTRNISYLRATHLMFLESQDILFCFLQYAHHFYSDAMFVGVRKTRTPERILEETLGHMVHLVYHLSIFVKSEMRSTTNQMLCLFTQGCHAGFLQAKFENLGQCQACFQVFLSFSVINHLRRGRLTIDQGRRKHFSIGGAIGEKQQI